MKCCVYDGPGRMGGRLQPFIYHPQILPPPALTHLSSGWCQTSPPAREAQQALCPFGLNSALLWFSRSSDVDDVLDLLLYVKQKNPGFTGNEREAPPYLPLTQM